MATIKQHLSPECQENQQLAKQLSKQLRNIEIKRISFWLIYLYILMVCLIFDIDIICGISIAAISCGFALFSARLHRRYLNIINLLKKENDTDFLTQVHNKRSGMEKMDNILCICQRTGQSINLYIIDIDYFKGYNDTFGHMAGDSALRRIADCQQQCFCRNSDLICRIGGEEFAVMTVGGDHQQAIAGGKRLQDCIANCQIEAADKSVSPLLTVSIGLIHQIPLPTAKLLNMINEADRQLYRAKNHSRNCICCNDRIIMPETYPPPVPPESGSTANQPLSTSHKAADNIP